MSTRRVVITGLGSISPLGMTVDDLWEGLRAGRCGIDTIKAFEPAGFTCRLAGEVPDFKIQKHVPKSYRKATKLMSRDIQLSIVAANEALQNAGFITKAIDSDNVNLDPTRTAINLGAGLISCDLLELAPAAVVSTTEGKFDILKWGQEGIESLTPIWLLKYLPNMLACHIGIIHDIQGPSNSITCGEASSILAISEAAEVISRNSADTALAGGCEAKVNPIVMLRQCLLKRATAESNDEPASACRPFDSGASGSVFGEAAGIIVLEEIEHAQKRGAKIYAEIAGFGSSNSINPTYEHIEPDGKGIETAIRKALTDAQISPEKIDLIIPHGTGIAEDDRAEAQGIQHALGVETEEIPVWPIKSMLSNTGAGAGALDVIAAAKAIETGKTGTAKNFDKPAAGCKLNIINEPLQKKIKYVLCCSYTFGGQTAAIILKNVDDEL